jgi:hypothetical protein
VKAGDRLLKVERRRYRYTDDIDVLVAVPVVESAHA